MASENTRIYYSFDGLSAAGHWANGGGATVQIDAYTHMTVGGGSVFSIHDFALDIQNAVQGYPVGSIIVFESNAATRLETGAARAVASHNYYVDNIFSSNSFVWGQTSAGFKGSVTSLSGGRYQINGEIRPYQETFDFKRNSVNPFIEIPRAIGALLTGSGQKYDIEFVGNGKSVSGIYRLGTYSRNRTPRLYEAQCFPAGTPIRLASGTTQTIESLVVGDVVSAFDDNFRGRGVLSGKRVTRLFQNITDTWVALSLAPTAELKWSH